MNLPQKSELAERYAGMSSDELALINQQTGKAVGFLNPRLYAQAVKASGFHDVTEGDNGAFDAAQGWDPCTGLGSPDGAKLLAALTGPQSMQASASVRSSERAGKSRESAA